MKLGHLLLLINAERKGHQIMKKTTTHYYMDTYKHCEEVKLSECELSDFINDDIDDVQIEFFIKKKD